MKLCYALPKNLNNQPGRFIFEVGGGDNEEIQRIVSEADGGSFDYSLRSAENTFTIADAELAEYQEDWPDFVEQHNAVKQEQRELMVTFDESTAIKSEIVSERMAALDVRRDYERNNLNLREQQDAFSDEVTRLSPQFDPPEGFIDFINQATNQPNAEISDEQIVNFVQAHGAQPGSLQFTRNVKIVSNNLARAQQLAQRQAELQQQEQAVQAQEAAVAARFDEFMEAEETLSQTTTRLSEIFQVDLPAIERQQANINIGLELKKLQDNIDVNEDGKIDLDEMNHHKQLDLLRLIAGEESIADERMADSRSDWSQYVDGWGRAVENLVPESIANRARRSIDYDEKVEIVSMLSPDVVESFIRFEPVRSKEFFSDQIGRNSFRLDFLANDYAEANIRLTDLLTTDQQFVKVTSDTGEIFYGYRTDAQNPPDYYNIETNQPLNVDTNYVIEGLTDASQSEALEQLITQRSEPLPEYSAVDQGVSEYNYSLEANEARLVNRVADRTTKNVYAYLGVNIGNEVKPEHHEAFLEATQAQFGDLPFFENFASSYQTLRSTLENSDTFNNSNGEAMSAADRSLLTTRLYEDFYAQTSAQMRESLATIRESDDPRAVEQLRAVGEIMEIFGESQTAVLTEEAAVLADKNTRIRQTLIETYGFTESEIEQLNEFLDSNQRFTNSEIVTFLANVLERDEFQLDENGQPGRRLMRLLSDLGTLHNIQAESEALHNRVEVHRMQEFMVSLSRDSDVQAFVGLVSPNLSSSNQALLQSIYAGEIVNPRDHLPALNSLVNAIATQEIPPGVDPGFANILRNGKTKMQGFIEGTIASAHAANEAEAASQRAYENAETTTSVARTFEETPDAVRLVYQAIGETGEIDQNLLAVFDQPEPDFSTEAVNQLITLSNSESYKSANSSQRAEMIAQTTNNPLTISADSNTLRNNYNFHLPTGVRYGQFTVNPNGSITGRFESSEVDYRVEADGTIIAEHLTGVPDSEDLQVPPDEWATAQALGAMTESFVIKSAAELAQDVESLGNMALVNFMRQYWGIRGRDTLPESELDKFKSLGEMMSDNQINFQVVLAQLNALKWDKTAAGNRALDVRHQFNEVLEAAAAGNNEGFRRLLRLDSNADDAPNESALLS